MLTNFLSFLVKWTAISTGKGEISERGSSNSTMRKKPLSHFHFVSSLILWEREEYKLLPTSPNLRQKGEYQQPRHPLEGKQPLKTCLLDLLQTK